MLLLLGVTRLLKYLQHKNSGRGRAGQHMESKKGRVLRCTSSGAHQTCHPTAQAPAAQHACSTTPPPPQRGQEGVVSGVQTSVANHF